MEAPKSNTAPDIFACSCKKKKNTTTKKQMPAEARWNQQACSSPLQHQNSWQEALGVILQPRSHTLTGTRYPTIPIPSSADRASGYGSHPSSRTSQSCSGTRDKKNHHRALKPFFQLNTSWKFWKNISPLEADPRWTCALATGMSRMSFLCTLKGKPFTVEWVRENSPDLPVYEGTDSHWVRGLAKRWEGDNHCVTLLTHSGKQITHSASPPLMWKC